MISRRVSDTLKALAVVVLVLGAAAAPAAAGDGQWQLRVSGILLDTGGGIEVETGIGGVHTSIDPSAGIGVSFERRLNDRLGFELGILAAAPDIDVTVGPAASPWWATTDLTSFTPITFGLNVHLTPDDPVDVYVGAMLAYVVYGDLRVAGGSTVNVDWSEFPYITVEPGSSVRIGSDVDLAWGLNLGADLRFEDSRWSAHARLSYLDTDYDIGDSFGLDSASVSFDPLIVALGFGYRF